VVDLSSLEDLVLIWNASPLIRTPFMLGVSQIPLTLLGSSLVYMAPLILEINQLFGTPSLLMVIILLVLGFV
jgi:hypothetical protein